MELQEDWGEAQQRLLAWWEGEILDRAAIQVTAPRAGMIPQSIPVPTELEAQWTDVDYVVASQGERIRSTYYGGEAFPLFNPNLGPDIFAGFLGAPIVFAPDTSWTLPIIDDWETRPVLALDPENRWWQLQTELIRAAQAAGRGRWITGTIDMHSGGDALSALRGRQQLCYDLIDCPQEVIAAMHELEAMVIEVNERMYPLVEWETFGSSTGWLPVWGADRSAVIQCDFLALISPAMAERFFLDELRVQAAWLDRVIFHLDGPQCIAHLDLLFGIPQIRAIQWVPGDGQPPMPHWIPLLRRIQEAGRSLHLTVRPQDVEVLLAELSPRGLMLNTTVGSEEEARALVRNVVRWTR